MAKVGMDGAGAGAGEGARGGRGVGALAAIDTAATAWASWSTGGGGRGARATGGTGSGRLLLVEAARGAGEVEGRGRVAAALEERARAEGEAEGDEGEVREATRPHPVVLGTPSMSVVWMGGARRGTAAPDGATGRGRDVVRSLTLCVDAGAAGSGLRDVDTATGTVSSVAGCTANPHCFAHSTASLLATSCHPRSSVPSRAVSGAVKPC